MYKKLGGVLGKFERDFCKNLRYFLKKLMRKKSEASWKNVLKIDKFSGEIWNIREFAQQKICKKN